MNSDQPPPEPSFPGGKAAERRREQLARQFGEDPPESTRDTAEDDEEDLGRPGESGTDGSGTRESSKE